MKFDNQTYRISGAGSIGQRLLLAGIAGLVLSGIGLFVDGRQFLHSYLVAFTFWVSVGLGALFFTILHHLVSASWSVVLRRMFENVMMALPLLFVFFIPIAFGMGHLYEWTDADKVAVDHLLQGKTGFLNNGFFLARTVIYFAIWSIIALLAYKLSLRQDHGHSEVLTARMKKVSAPGMILLAIMLTFAAWDWLMSLDAHWYSTIFGAYYFAGSALSALAVVTLIAIYLRRKQVLVKQITLEHYHDLAKLLFAFMVFWAYMAFSQYFLIWYANIPEETIWFQHRWVGSWKAITLLLVFGHFVVPFLVLISRAAKRSTRVLAFAGLWLLLMHWMDLHWLVMPNLHSQGFQPSWMDLTTVVGIGGVFLAIVWKRLCAQPLVPVNDPKLAASIGFVNQ
jgi:hypothetical protein